MKTTNMQNATASAMMEEATVPVGIWSATGWPSVWKDLVWSEPDECRDVNFGLCVRWRLQQG